jgi:hypothetical protein
LAALVNLLQTLPNTILLPNLPTLIPVFQDALRQQIPQIQETILPIIKLLLQENGPAISDEIDSFVDSLIKLIIHSSSTEIMRRDGVECLGLVPKSGILKSKLILCKSRVLNTLLIALDDSKRSVRKEAAIARATWFLI